MRRDPGVRPDQSSMSGVLRTFLGGGILCRKPVADWHLVRPSIFSVYIPSTNLPLVSIKCENNVITFDILYVIVNA